MSDPILNWDILIDTSDLEFQKWQTVREASKELIEKVANNARVYPYFELEFDPHTLQRKVTPLLRGINADAGIYHAWMCGITAAEPIRGADGQTSEMVGGSGTGTFTWKLNLEIEGFFDNNGDDPWTIAEEEIQKVHLIFFRNQDMILQYCKFYEFDWTSIDLEAFADGNNLIVAQASCRVDLQISIEI